MTPGASPQPQISGGRLSAPRPTGLLGLRSRGVTERYLDEPASAVIFAADGCEVLVDAADHEWLSQYRWHVSAWKPGKVYAKSCLGRLRHGGFAMHRLIMNAPAGLEVDHVNGDGLDNRRANLRLATRRQNSANTGSRRGTSKYKGVSWNRQRNRWIAQIRRGGKVCRLGRFRDEEEAARVYDKAALQEHGEFARLNFPDDAA